MSALRNLIGFQSQTFTLIYQATVDGFQASNFHAKADGIPNTITVIQTTNGNIFGGYTAASWSLNVGYIADSTAFLFSLVNPQNAPYKIMIPGTYVPFAICSQLSYGPTFGNGHDLCIADNSNINTDSYNFISSYPNPNGYMDGVYHFQTVEIQVFKIT